MMTTPGSNSASIGTLALTAGSAYAITRIFQAWYSRYELRHIPSVGLSAPLLSYFGALRFFRHAKDLLHEGYIQHHGGAFKLPWMTRWLVVITGKERIEELRRMPDDVASFQEAVNEAVQVKYTLGEEVATDSFHADTVRSPLTRAINSRFEDVQDEIVSAFAEHLPATEDWTSVRPIPASMIITCRTSNRLFVGLPLCRNMDYLRLNIGFAGTLIKTGKTLSLFPELLRPTAAFFMTNLPKSIDQALNHLRPILDDRLEKERLYGVKWEGRPSDVVSWLLDTGGEGIRNIRSLTLRILLINFAAIHTTSMTFTQVLFDLAKHPEYILELREEVEPIVKEEGVTKVSMLKMVKLDSFIKESQRMAGIASLTIQRLLLRDYTFADGLFIPKGTFVAVPAMEVHTDESFYGDPSTFDGLRYTKMAADTDTYNKHSVVALTNDYLVFGSGRHACPGRFFAVNEIKAFIVHILMNYDVMIDPDSPPYKNIFVNSSAVPDPTSSIMIRKRRT